MTAAARYGAKGGRSKSRAKVRAARRNGRLGGRPRNVALAEMMSATGMSRAWCYKRMRKKVEIVAISGRMIFPGLQVGMLVHCDDL